MLKKAFEMGRAAAFRKFALGPPTQVDQFVADVESGKDVMPQAAQPPMAGPMGTPPALDGHIPMPPPPPFGAGSTVAPELMGATTPPPATGMLGG